MKKPFVSSILLLASLAVTQEAFAKPICDDIPDTRLKYGLGQYTSVQLDPGLETELDAHLADIVTPDPGVAQITTGAVLMVARRNKIVYHKAIGLRDGNTSLGGDPAAPMTTNAIFDLESMTKPFTAAVILKMRDHGLLDLDDLVIDYLPDFEFIVDPSNPPALIGDPNKASVTIRDMLRYMGGLDVDLATNLYGDPDPYLTMNHAPSIAATGTSVRYSDLTYRLLGQLAEVAYADTHVTPKTFRELVSLYITGPLQMADTAFEPILTMPAKMSRVAGTGNFAHYGTDPNVPAGYRWGEVQDEQDWWTQRHDSMFPGVQPTGTGCDGLFSTAWDLGQFAQLLLNDGKVFNPYTCNYNTILSATSVEGLTNIQTLDGNGDPVGQVPSSFGEDLLYADKAYGFELMDGVESVGGSWLPGVYKTGGAGTFLLIDPINELFIVVLTNHGLPNLSVSLDPFDEMVEEIGPHRIADSVVMATQDFMPVW